MRKIVILTRFHRVDNIPWRKELVGFLNELNYSVTVVFGGKSIYSHYQEARIRFDAQDFIKMGKKILMERLSENSGKENHEKSEKLIDFCSRNGIEYKLVDKINSEITRTILKNINPDIIIISNSGIVKEHIIECAKIGALNAHYGLLPQIRGMNAIEWSILLNKKTGVSIHYVDKGIDTGDILVKGRAHQSVSCKLLKKVVPMILDNNIKTIPQEPSEGKQYFKMHPCLLKKVERKLRNRQ
jgi:folate-dependent phosphoribosylglycinamide formyltransferase PurN